MLAPRALYDRLETALTGSRDLATVILIGIIVVCVVLLLSRSNTLRTAAIVWMLLP